MSGFTTLGICAEINGALKEQGIIEPTPIQEKTIPIALLGNDVIAQAQTGTGKTFAFLLPILQTVDPQQTSIQSLIITPTRELALQITTEAKKITRFLNNVHVLAIYGGQDLEKQVRKLTETVQVVMGTPGRILDHVRRGTIDLSKVSTLVLDEADQMLQMGFLTEVENIIRETASNRQTMLFSATMPPQIRSLATRYMDNPQDIRIKRKSVVVER